ncbi:hypothetical protein KA005_00790 [bacterium]|nr:hypothetical protein [bacterium]
MKGSAHGSATLSRSRHLTMFTASFLLGSRLITTTGPTLLSTRRAFPNSRRGKTGTGDKGQLLFLATRPKFQALLDRFWKESGVAPISIDLPVISELTSRVSPPGLSRGRYRLDVLSAEDLFLALYQIRCNLMHGSKDPRRDARDSELCQLSASFSVPFLTYLIRHTFGEVLNAYDPDVASKMPVP